MVRQVLLELLVQQALLEWQAPQVLPACLARQERKALKDSLAPQAQQAQMERP